MLKKLQALKAKKGFTLVELIVVIAIIAVLAAILVPTLLNQVTNSRITSADSTATTIRDTINTWLVEKNAADGTLYGSDSGSTTYYGLGATVKNGAEASATEVDADLTKTMREAYDFTGSEEYMIILENHKVVGVAFCATSDLPSMSWTSGSSSSSGHWNQGGQVTSGGKTVIVGTCPKSKST